jgi:hypothetical protein
MNNVTHTSAELADPDAVTLTMPADVFAFIASLLDAADDPETFESMGVADAANHARALFGLDHDMVVR